MNCSLSVDNISINCKKIKESNLLLHKVCIASLAITSYFKNEYVSNENVPHKSFDTRINYNII